MNTIKAITIIFLGVTANVAYAQEDYRNDITFSATGSFQRTVTGNGITQSAKESPGMLITYRYFFTDRQALELNYGFSRADQRFATGTSSTSATRASISSNTTEANLSYVARFGVWHKLRPFVSAGVGALIFSPVNNVTVNGVSGTVFATPDFVYSGGVELALGKRTGFRLGYRGHVFQAPDFGAGTLATGAIGHIAEPFGGFVVHF
ncbi:MAG: porin family protein [Acidobacteriota bacterium]|nr:porin family protein [Acidobacteriota bacterium]